MHPKGVNEVPTTEKLSEVTSCAILKTSLRAVFPSPLLPILLSICSTFALRGKLKSPLAELLQICPLVYVRDTAYHTSPPPISIRNRHAFSLRFYTTSAVHPLERQADEMEGHAQGVGKDSQIVDSSLALPHLYITPIFSTCKRVRAREPFLSAV